MTFTSTLADCWLGLCRKAPVLHTTAAVVLGDSGETPSIQPDAGGAAGRQGRIRNGIGIATASIRALFSEKRLLGFSFLSGLVILFLVLAEQWNLSHIGTSYAISNLITIQISDTHLIAFDLRLFLIEAVCLSGFTLLLAALVRYRNARNTAMPITVHRAFREAGRHAGTLAALSITMAFVATILLEIASQNPFTGTIVSAISHAMFWLPYAYYFTPNGIFTTLFFSFQMVVANAVLFLLALYVVPAIVLEDKGLISAIAGSFRLVKKTWRELLGCALVFGAIILGVALIGLIIGQSPALLNNDYDFFLQESRGQVLMMAACYVFLLACGMLMALGTTVPGIAITDLYTCGKKGSVSRAMAKVVTPVSEPHQ
ncbi:hypothetical protein [Methanoregula sp.]|uniref:hypothetical protein n=1 Tax=Methanoregula sp. TaxID=2052170 RepID=UPI00262DD291|nr:hypothetical protein [Methanoregula sp.]MDD5143919.1 hypothetical protein [Methanoregula sp.]